MTCSLQYWCRTPYWSAILPFYSLDQLTCPEVVDMNNTQCETVNMGNDERSNLPLFFERLLR